MFFVVFLVVFGQEREIHKKTIFILKKEKMPYLRKNSINENLKQIRNNKRESKFVMDSTLNFTRIIDYFNI